MIGTAHSDLLQTALNQKASIVNVSSISRLMASMFEIDTTVLTLKTLMSVAIEHKLPL